MAHQPQASRRLPSLYNVRRQRIGGAGPGSRPPRAVAAAMLESGEGAVGLP